MGRLGMAWDGWGYDNSMESGVVLRLGLRQLNGKWCGTTAGAATTGTMLCAETGEQCSRIVTANGTSGAVVSDGYFIPITLVPFRLITLDGWMAHFGPDYLHWNKFYRLTYLNSIEMDDTINLREWVATTGYLFTTRIIPLTFVSVWDLACHRVAMCRREDARIIPGMYEQLISGCFGANAPGGCVAISLWNVSGKAAWHEGLSGAT